MLNSKYANRVLIGTGFSATHVVKTDPNRLKDFFSVDGTWFWRSEPGQIVDGARISENNQVIGLVGAFPAEPASLGGEVTVWVDGKQNTLKKSSLIFVPAGVTFGPVQIDHMEYPIFYNSIGVRPEPGSQRNPSWPHYTIVSETKAKAVQPPMPAKMTMRGYRLLHMEDDMAKGSFYVDYVWFYEGTGHAPMGVHKHDCEELIAMTGCDPEAPYDLGGSFSVDLGGETHYVNKSCLICIPPNVDHCPWNFLDVKKPTLAFTATPSAMYNSSEKKQW